jgi:hypothetical protein
MKKTNKHQNRRSNRTSNSNYSRSSELSFHDIEKLALQIDAITRQKLPDRVMGGLMAVSSDN